MSNTTNNIESLFHESRSFSPPPDFAQKARIDLRGEQALRQAAAEDLSRFWGDLARQEIDWKKPFTQILKTERAPHYEWFYDGLLNVSVNCLDRHIATRGDQPAILFEGEPGDRRTFTYSQLLAAVSQFANALKSLGVQPGDRIIIFMPMIPEAIIAMQACARIGAIHSVVFAGFSAMALQSRINDARARIVITADGGHRGGDIVPLKQSVDTAIDAGTPSVEKVIVYRRTGLEIAWHQERDLDWSEITEHQSDQCPPEWVNAEHPVFLLYTSGSTGTPKGVQHASAGYLLWAILTNKWVFDLHDHDVLWCTADIGWITGHTYVAYGPLAIGATQLLYEGHPTYPESDRVWTMIDHYHISVFYTAPTLIRMLQKLGDEWPERHDLSSLRLLGSVGEPINPEAWLWYHRIIGKERCPIVDTWWQTETGGAMISPMPGVTATKPGSCTRPLPGIDADVVDPEGQPITDPNAGGYLVIKHPWPSMIRTVWGNEKRYRETYWEQFDGRYYVSGDMARKDEDGYFWILGRSDDVIKVAGHRLGTMELESALAAQPLVSESAVVGIPDEIKGEAIVAFVVLKTPATSTADAEQWIETLENWLVSQIGPIAKPKKIVFTEDLPKTRSGKIMRRLLRAIAAGEPITSDISTLENADIIDRLSQQMKTTD